ncbi:MAG: hypothetical protein U1F61_01900 [Opitutaceae bacterium]
MQADPFTGRPSRVRGSLLLSAEDQAALQHDHDRRLEALARLSAAAEGVGFGTDPDDDLVLSAEGGLSLLAGADAIWAELDAALAEFRSLLPVVPLGSFGFPEESEDPFGEGSPRLRRIGSGVEASAFQSEDGSIYKFFLPREGGRIGGSFSFVRGGDDVAWMAEASLGSYRDLLQKLQLILALGGMPTEVVAVTPEGVLVVKQSCGERLPEDTDTSTLLPSELIPIPARFLRARRDHPRLFFWKGGSWLVADLHAKNMVRAVDRTLRVIDLLAAPLPIERFEADPLLRQWLMRVRHDPNAGVLPDVADEDL